MSYRSAMSHIRWFISRENGVLVPLGPIDELPCTIQLQGVPRALSRNNVKGKDFLGEVPATSFSFKYIQTTIKDDNPAYASLIPEVDYTGTKTTGTFADSLTYNDQHEHGDNTEPLVSALNHRLSILNSGPVGKPCTPSKTPRSSFLSDST